MNLVEQYKQDRELTRTMVLATFERDSVPQELIEEYFKHYDKESEVGEKIAEWLDANRPKEEAKDAT